MKGPKQTATQVKSSAKRGYERGRRGVVYVITSDKIIQAVLTGAVTGFVFSVNEGFAAYIQRWVVDASGVFVPTKLIAALGAVLVFVGAYYADQHTEEWREYVRDVTGEETAEDTASAEDVTGESKG